MKLIKIQHYSEPDKLSVYIERQKYKITLGNDYQIFFSDKRDLSAFLNNTNIFLNEKFQELNLFYIDTFTIFRCAWIYFDKPELKQKEITIIKIFAGIDKDFNLIIQRSGTPNGNYLVWRFLNSISSGFLDILKSLQPFFKYKGQVDRFIKINNLLKSINVLIIELKIYPETEQNLKKKIKQIL